MRNTQRIDHTFDLTWSIAEREIAQRDHESHPCGLVPRTNARVDLVGGCIANRSGRRQQLSFRQPHFIVRLRLGVVDRVRRIAHARVKMVKVQGNELHILQPQTCAISGEGMCTPRAFCVHHGQLISCHEPFRPSYRWARLANFVYHDTLWGEANRVPAPYTGAAEAMAPQAGPATFCRFRATNGRPFSAFASISPRRRQLRSVPPCDPIAHVISYHSSISAPAARLCCVRL